jgi:hypothetical protein
MFRSLEIFLGHTAKISLILWPEARGNESRGNQLRTLLELNDNNPLRDRSARNDMQHFDERIDQWANSTGGRIFVDSNVGPYPIPIRINGESPEALRHFDPKAQLFVFRSQKYDIGVLVEAVRDVLSRANESGRAITETMKREAIKEGIRRNERLKTTPKQD